MANLTILEQESLDILKQLEYCCDSAKLRNFEVRQEEMIHSEDFYEDDIHALNIALFKKNKFLIIPYSEIDFSVLKKHMDIHNVEKYLQENGLRFHLSLDFIFDDPTRLETSEDPSAIYSELGIINGESVEEIKKQIQMLIDKLESKENVQRSISIIYNINIGQFLFNGEDSIELSGRQKDTADCLVEKGQNIKVSWDEIYEKFQDSTTDKDIPNSFELDKQKRSVRTSVNEINNHVKIYLNDELIGAKGNEYWLQFKVEKGR